MFHNNHCNYCFFLFRDGRHCFYIIVLINVIGNTYLISTFTVFIMTAIIFCFCYYAMIILPSSYYCYHYFYNCYHYLLIITSFIVFLVIAIISETILYFVLFSFVISYASVPGGNNSIETLETVTWKLQTLSVTRLVASSDLIVSWKNLINQQKFN